MIGRRRRTTTTTTTTTAARRQRDRDREMMNILKSESKINFTVWAQYERVCVNRLLQDSNHRNAFLF